MMEVFGLFLVQYLVAVSHMQQLRATQVWLKHWVPIVFNLNEPTFLKPPVLMCVSVNCSSPLGHAALRSPSGSGQLNIQLCC